MSRKETVIYLAGLVDGEGYIGIKKTKYARHCPSPTYHERIQVRMVEEKAISLIKQTFGGNYYKETEHSKYSKRPLYCYAISDLIASKACKFAINEGTTPRTPRPLGPSGETQARQGVSPGMMVVVMPLKRETPP